MSSQSRFIYNLNPKGLGSMPAPMTGPINYENRFLPQPIDSGSGTGTTLKPTPLQVETPTFLPTPDQVQEPITSKATINPNPHAPSNHDSDNGWASIIAGLIRIEGENVVVGGDRRIKKKTLYVAGGTVITAGLLVALIR